ncbi:hypothetical protein F0L68_11920 [Solihabitans fulvus]|uniref:LPXTG-motif cell wall anchor domain-containing protein n=1 Tax=Solihabitans fulvus TaxID=1892852 RepID=A0A5B2XHF2_9PSEU|nr:hypothetical protein [Solihabitans fulvus]KAA2262604.1 hypothetical protein F0L68_11920 [Solihabitans fulvus]
MSIARATRAVVAVGVFAAVAAFGATPAASASGRPVELRASANPVADLYPGGRGASQFSVDNPNPFPVRLLSVSFGSVTSSDPAGCPADLVRMVDRPLPADSVVGAGERARTYAVPAAFTLSADAPNACQGKTFLVATRVRAIAVDDAGRSPSGDQPGPDAQELAWTGAAIALPIACGATLLAGGWLLLLFGRRRRARTTPRG